MAQTGADFRAAIRSLLEHRPDGDPPGAQLTWRETVRAMIRAARYCDARTDPREEWNGEAWSEFHRWDMLRRRGRCEGLPGASCDHYAAHGRKLCAACWRHWNGR